MRHNWILDVLRDLRSYAEMNGLPAIAVAAAQTLEVAQTEIPKSQREGTDPVQGASAHD